MTIALDAQDIAHCGPNIDQFEPLGSNPRRGGRDEVPSSTSGNENSAVIAQRASIIVAAHDEEVVTGQSLTPLLLAFSQ